ncbi:MAG TPA: GMC family oxidoreductase [Steroidobacteraceae bacterium]|jgi:choline dehydrogenase-like flavoprotein|nr:GMC family oxidoreductase [Steroidobacteraceae bacterium]
MKAGIWRGGDLDRDPLPASIDCEVCVIGAGPVGLAVARALAERRRRVVLLEQGPRIAERQDAAEVEFGHEAYAGATIGRAFGAGGTSTLWGGQLLPVREADLHGRPQIGAPPWPIPFAEIERHFPVLERWLRVVPGSYAIPRTGMPHPLAALEWGDLAPRISKWTPFGRRNLDVAFGSALGASGRVRAVYRARAADWTLAAGEDGRRLAAVAVRSPGGLAMAVRANAYVLCAGALETARCALELREAAGAAPPEDAAGRYLHDHLSLRVARVRVKDRARFHALFAPVFDGPVMRSLRMELAEDSLAREGLPALYAHFLFEIRRDSGFGRVRDLLRGLQQGRVGEALRHAAYMPLVLPGVAEMAFERYVRRRLPFPRGADIHLQCDFEQAPTRENRVRLGERGRDGRRKLRIDWKPEAGADRIARAVHAAVGRLWARNGLERIARLEPVEPEAGEVGANLHDIYHPAGTTRMSADPSDGVVDPDLRMHGLHNVYIAGSAVFPSMGAANPTFTAMALGLRLAEHLDTRLKTG